MKKANGFTLVELLGVIVIISIISLIAAPKIIERFTQKKAEASEAAKQILYAATREYISSNQSLFNTNESYYCVTINDLINSGKLVEPVIDVQNNTVLSGSTTIEVTNENNQYQFTYNSARCNQ